MSDRVFFDSNVLVYGFGPFDAAKSITARRLIVDGAVSQQGVLSYQVLQEFLNVALRKFQPQVSTAMAAAYLDEVVGGMEVVPWSMDLMMSGLSIKGRYGFSWYDSLIVAAALQSGCARLYTEDLQPGQKIEGLTIVNPFL